MSLAHLALWFFPLPLHPNSGTGFCQPHTPAFPIKAGLTGSLEGAREDELAQSSGSQLVGLGST